MNIPIIVKDDVDSHRAPCFRGFSPIGSAPMKHWNFCSAKAHRQNRRRRQPARSDLRVRWISRWGDVWSGIKTFTWPRFHERRSPKMPWRISSLVAWGFLPQLAAYGCGHRATADQRADQIAITPSDPRRHRGFSTAACSWATRRSFCLICSRTVFESPPWRDGMIEMRHEDAQLERGQLDGVQEHVRWRPEEP